MAKKREKIIVAISGGVDSAVALLTLKDKGYEVIGLFLRLEEKQSLSETSARKICQKLKVKFYSINAYQKFNKNVIQYFCSAYSKGITPNPCVECNKTIKFGELLKYIKILGANYLATGHYTRLQREITNSKLQITKYKLFQAKDKSKDQSYFLYNLTQAQLSKIIFPLAAYTKNEIKKIAEKNKLPCDKNESQDICFLEGDHNNFLKKNIKLKTGPIKDLAGKKLGQHLGLPLYTIGQRKGIELGGTGPYYVVKTDYKTNTLYVTNEANYKELFSNQLNCKNINWIGDKTPKMPFNCSAKIRYGHKANKCTINQTKDRISVKFEKAQRAITPGQSVVFYKKNELLGGGIII